MAEIEFERRIAAPPSVVFTYLTDGEKWAIWQGTAVELDPRPGGVHRVNIRGDGFAAGEFVEVVQDTRVAFTWGFEHEENPLRPGSTLVEIDLVADGDDTILRFRQSALPDGFEAVGHGWSHYLDRLAIAGAGLDPGPDPNVLV